LQLQIYAVLWNQDEVLNPTGRLATRLILAHPRGDTAVPVPTMDAIAELETQLATRGAAARHAVSNDPPEAKPGSQQCRFCSVRHLCETYWQPEIQKRIANETADEPKSFIDTEVTVKHRHGPKSWDIVIGTDGGKGLLRTNGDLDLLPRQKLRILDAALAAEDKESAGIRCLTIGMFSEVYVVSPPSR
jgi:hypothetical protein